jgi:para-nitrobenzyl esterase
MRFALAAAFSILIAGPAFADPQVTIPQGTLAGTTDGGISVFKDIPFAAPPIGDLRWRAPQPAANWSGVRDAS